MQTGRIVERLSAADLVAGKVTETYTANLMLASRGFTRDQHGASRLTIEEGQGYIVRCLICKGRKWKFSNGRSHRVQGFPG